MTTLTQSVAEATEGTFDLVEHIFAARATQDGIRRNLPRHRETAKGLLDDTKDRPDFRGVRRRGCIQDYTQRR